MDQNAIDLKNITFSFIKEGQPFLRLGSFVMEREKIHVLTGENGIGKSTFFSILSGSFSKAAHIQGEIEIFGRKCSFNDPLIRQILSSRVKCVRQRFDDMLVPDFSFRDHLHFVPLLHNGRWFHGMKKKADFPSIIRELGIPLDIPVRCLSGGQRQILAICSVVQSGAEILLLDEPAAALDRENEEKLYIFLRSVIEACGVSIFLITHKLEHALSHVDGRIYELIKQENQRILVQKSICTLLT